MGIALREEVPPCRQWSAIAITSLVKFVIVSVTSIASVPYTSSTTYRNKGSSRSRVKSIRTTDADCTNETEKASKVSCGAHIINQRPMYRRSAWNGDVEELTATLTWLPPGVRASR